MKVTSVKELLELPVGAVVDTGILTRTRTHDSDEWDMVMTAEEVLQEGGGCVTVLNGTGI